MSLKRKIFIVIAIILAVAATVSLFVINKTTGKINQGEISAIEKTVPVQTGQLFVAPATDDWWKFISDISYASKELAVMKPIDANEGIVRIGYAQSVNTKEEILSGGAIRTTYFETETPENASALATWFKDNKAEGAPYTVFNKDNIVALTPDWVVTEDVPFPEETLGEDSSYVTATGTWYRNAGVGYGYLDFETYFEALMATQEDETVRNVLNEYITYQFGLEDKKGIWAGNASKYNTLWEGTFLSGGFKESLIDQQRAADILQGREEILDDDGQIAVIDPRESKLLSYVALSVPSKDTVADKAEFNSFFAPYDEAFSDAGYTADESLMRGAISTVEWNSTLSGKGSRTENIAAYLFAVKDNKMAFTFLRAS